MSEAPPPAAAGRRELPLGVVLAGGRGRRFGDRGKTGAEVLGRPLIGYALKALADALGAPPVVVAKQVTPLPELAPDIEVWIEPAEPSHPLVGIVTALRRARGRSVFVCAADMPLLDPGEIAAIAGADPRGAPAVVPRVEGRLQPLCAVYRPAALPALEAALESQAPLSAVLERLAPLVIDRARAEPYLNVNARGDIAAAEVALRRRGGG